MNDKEMKILQNLEKSVDFIQTILHKMDEREKNHQENKAYISYLRKYSQQINAFLTDNDLLSPLQIRDKNDKSILDRNYAEFVKVWDIFNRIKHRTETFLTDKSETILSDPLHERLKTIQNYIQQILQMSSQEEVFKTNATLLRQKQYTTIQVDLINSIISVAKEIDNIIQAPELL